MYIYRAMLKDRVPYIEKVSDTYYEEKVIEDADVLKEYIEDVFHLKDAGEEHLVMLCLNHELKPVSAFEISHGTASRVSFSPRDVFKMALLGGAMCIVLARNSTTGSAFLGKDDEKILRSVVRAEKAIDIKLIDYLIFGDTVYSAHEDLRL